VHVYLQSVSVFVIADNEEAMEAIDLYYRTGEMTTRQRLPGHNHPEGGRRCNQFINGDAPIR